MYVVHLQYMYMYIKSLAFSAFFVGFLIKPTEL